MLSAEVCHIDSLHFYITDEGLDSLDATQNAIVSVRKQIVADNLDAKEVMAAFCHKWRYDNIDIICPRNPSHRHSHSHSKHVALFYLFNDLVQYASRSHLHGFLEAGPSIFLPEV
jgi:hypothetical protein